MTQSRRLLVRTALVLAMGLVGLASDGRAAPAAPVPRGDCGPYCDDNCSLLRCVPNAACYFSGYCDFWPGCLEGMSLAVWCDPIHPED